MDVKRILKDKVRWGLKNIRIRVNGAFIGNLLLQSFSQCVVIFNDIFLGAGDNPLKIAVVKQFGRHSTCHVYTFAKRFMSESAAVSYGTTVLLICEVNS